MKRIAASPRLTMAMRAKSVFMVPPRRLSALGALARHHGPEGLEALASDRSRQLDRR